MTKVIHFRFNSQGKDKNPKHPDHVKKKSQRQKKRDFDKRNLFEKKVENPTCLFKSLIIATQRFILKNWYLKFDDCEFEGLAYKGFNIHKGKQQHTGS